MPGWYNADYYFGDVPIELQEHAWFVETVKSGFIQSVEKAQSMGLLRYVWKCSGMGG